MAMVLERVLHNENGCKIQEKFGEIISGAKNIRKIACGFIVCFNLLRPSDGLWTPILP
jgi:hypothetical protein